MNKLPQIIFGILWVVYVVIQVALILLLPVAALWFFGNLFGNYVSPMGGRQI
jgi:hypothetical protein